MVTGLTIEWLKLFISHFYFKMFKNYYMPMNNTGHNLYFVACKNHHDHSELLSTRHYARIHTLMHKAGLAPVLTSAVALKLCN